MTDPEDPREQRVRDLLGELGSGGAEPPGPVPPAVTARLEDTLAALVEEQQAVRISEERSATTTVVPLRPRWLPRFAAGAAAVVVLGLGGVAVSNLDVFDSPVPTTSDAGGSSAERSAGSAQAPAPSTGADDGGIAKGLVRAPAVRSARFEADVRALLRTGPPLRAARKSAADAAPRTPTADPSAGSASVSTCTGPRLGDGSRTTPIVLDGTAAALVLRPPLGGSRAVEAWSCDGTTRLATGEVPR